MGKQINKQAVKTHEKAFEALGEPMRRIIFEKIKTRPLSVGDIAKGLPISRPAVSQHLRVLKDAGLVSIQQKGTKNLCQVDAKGILAMRDYLDDFWDTALAAFKSLAEKQTKK